MPRISAEARGAAAFRAGGSVPEPPRHLSKEAAEIWRKIAASKPVDWFDDGAMALLEDYCAAVLDARYVNDRLEKARATDDEPDDHKSLRKQAALSSTRLIGLATKLRLSVQAQIDRNSRKITERGTQEAAGDKLIGGKAVWGENKAH